MLHRIAHNRSDDGSYLLIGKQFRPCKNWNSIGEVFVCECFESDRSDVISVDKGNLTISCGGKNQALLNDRRSMLEFGEILHEPGWAQHDPSGRMLLDILVNLSQHRSAFFKRR